MTGSWQQGQHIELGHTKEMKMATILLVEDDDDLRYVLRRRIEADEHLVIEATDGSKAIQCWRLHALDLIITDFQLPYLDGLAVIRAVSSQQPTLPIILMSAGMKEQLCLSVLQHFPSVRYLPKDDLSSHLRRYVKEALTRGRIGSDCS